MYKERFQKHPKNKPSFLHSVQQLAIISLIILAIVLLVIHTLKNQHETNVRIEKARNSYVKSQRQLIKNEVDQVVNVINFETTHRLEEAQKNVRSRVLEGYAIAENIYNRNKVHRSEEEIKKLIIDALRSIRYDNGRGYYFIDDFEGVPHLLDDTPEKEGTSLLDSKDQSERRVMRDLIDIVQSKGEGFYSYEWTKPTGMGGKFPKVSYVKHFEPYDWIIGTGVYLDSVESAMQQIIYQYVDTNRFGPNNQGYVFINELLDINGGKEFAAVYANPNRPDDKGKFISDEYKDAKGKMFRREFLKGLREQGECFVDYWYHKIDNPQPSPKTSFFKLAGNGRFIVAAGVYLDDVEENILEIQSDLKFQLQQSYVLIISVFFVVTCALVLLIHLLSKKLTTDYRLFVDFFKQAADSSEVIERKKIRFSEFDQLAEYANQMLVSKSEAEGDLRNERERLLVTLHSIMDGVIATDKDNRIVIFNRVAEELTGWQRHEAVGKKLKEIYQLKKAASSHADIDRTADDSGMGEKEVYAILVGRSGEEYQIVTSTASICSDDHNVLGNLIVFRDETERLKTEKELLNARKLESIGILAGGIAHDFNNILAGLFGNIELAKLNLENDHKAYKFLKTAHDSLERATDLTSQLLTFAKGGEPVLEAVNLKQLMHDVVSFNLSGSHIKAVYEIPEDLWRITADQGQISQVVSNLVINAQHSMPNGGHLYILADNVPAGSSGSERDMVMLQIRDQGVGISKEIIDRIFDPYFSTKQTGSGLGLAMVKGIIEKHQGRIDVESTLDEGTTFTVLLPAEKEAAQQEPEKQEMQTEKGVGNSLRTLVIDDDQTVAVVLSDMLSLMGCEVDLAQDGDAGVEKYAAALQAGSPYDIVFLDLTIPGGKGGKEAIKDILAIYSDAKVVAISGYSTDPIMAHYQEYGFSGRLTKPFQLDELRAEFSRLVAN